MGLSDFDGGADYYDEVGKIFVMTQNDMVIGGARVVASTNEKPERLPLEIEGFQLSNVFPDYSLLHQGYCEITRLAIHPDFRSDENYLKLLSTMTEDCVELGYSYLFSIAPKVQSRHSRKFFHSMGYQFDILEGIYPKTEELYKSLKNVVLCSMSFERKYYPQLQYEKANLNVA